MSQINSFTRFMYYLELSRQFLEDYKRTCKLDVKNDVNGWLNKINFVKKDAYSLMNEDCRELYIQELSENADPLFSANISEMWMKMTEQQRMFFELAGEGILNGDIVVTNEKELYEQETKR